MPDAPETRYAKSGDCHIGYQVFGEGPIDLLELNTGTISIDFYDEEPHYERYERRLAAFSRVIRFDPRGIGLSDASPESAPFTLELWTGDALSVLDAAGSERATLVGTGLGGFPALLLAATHPERVGALVLVHAVARVLQADDFPLGLSADGVASIAGVLDPNSPPAVADMVSRMATPSLADDPRYRAWERRAGNRSAGPARAAEYYVPMLAIDLREMLGTIAVPTLILQRRDNVLTRVGNGRFLADHIAGSKYVELGGADFFPFSGAADEILDEIEEFVTGTRPLLVPDRVLATVLFTDIVRSTELASAVGDRRWRELLDEHNALVRRHLERFSGREIKTVGDGFIATFDGPARAVACACAIRDGVERLGLSIRAGAHTGEVELRTDDVTGVAVHIASRIAGLAGGGEVLVSSTVKDLVVGSGIRFTDRGMHTLKGIPDEWRLHAVDG